MTSSDYFAGIMCSANADSSGTNFQPITSFTSFYSSITEGDVKGLIFKCKSTIPVTCVNQNQDCDLKLKLSIKPNSKGTSRIVLSKWIVVAVFWVFIIDWVYILIAFPFLVNRGFMHQSTKECRRCQRFQGGQLEHCVINGNDKPPMVFRSIRDEYQDRLVCSLLEQLFVHHSISHSQLFLLRHEP